MAQERPDLEDILEEIDEAIRAGREIDVEALACEHAALADEIRGSAEVLKRLHQWKTKHAASNDR